MPNAINDIVQVNITSESSSVSRTGFGTPLLVPGTAHATFAPRTRLYEGGGTQILASMVTDGFATTSEAYLQASSALRQDPQIGSVKIGRVDAGDADAAAAYAAITAADEDFTGFCWGTRAEADILALAAANETTNHIYIAQTADAAVLAETAGNVLEDLEGLGYRKTALMFHDPSTEDYADAAWLARGLVADLDVAGGQITWANKELIGIATDDLTSAQRSYIHGLNGNTYETRAKSKLTRDGKMVGGEYIDVTLGILWLDARITEDVFAALAGTPTRIPLSQDGIDIIEAIVRRRLQIAVDNGILLEFEITTPTFDQVSSSDRAARTLRNVFFRATIAGALHTIQIDGKVSV